MSVTGATLTLCETDTVFDNFTEYFDIEIWYVPIDIFGDKYSFIFELGSIDIVFLL